MPPKTVGKVDLKVVLLGRWYCGKTSLVERFVNGRFEEKYQNTIGAAFSAKTLKIDNEELVVAVWDTVGDERYESISKMYYRNAKAAVVCYDLTDVNSWERAMFWVEEVRTHEEVVKIAANKHFVYSFSYYTLCFYNQTKCKIYLCGTKLDLIKNTDRAMDFRDVTKYAKEVEAKEFETSSKTGENIAELFEEIVKDHMAFRLTLDSEDGRQYKTETVKLQGGKKPNFFVKLGAACCT